ncbi:GAF domain-containing protein [Halobaculum sp. MBLA0147]|uniref:GAF domain-containing protein n=1 Tax=Halobaculum sp. MBLA0147 TaxID=3079934 RepID=UPI003525ADB5
MLTHRILCVDPDTEARADTAAELRTELSDLDPTVETADGVAEAEAALDEPVAAVVTEYDLPDGSGFDVIDAAKDASPDAGCVLYTDTDPDTIDTTAIRGTITEYVGKDSLFGADRLARLIRTTVETRVQASYPLPQNEDERLAALRSYDLADEALIDSLDRITDLAATHFDVSRASINIINEHSQDFLACHGGATEWESMDREDSICTFTILEDDDVMTVPDVTDDPRFETRSETLIDMGIRSYMGANLVTSAGLRIGPLCVYDEVPREFDADDEAYLADLAAVAVDLLELHSRVDAPAATDGGVP